MTGGVVAFCMPVSGCVAQWFLGRGTWRRVLNAMLLSLSLSFSAPTARVRNSG